MENNKDKEYPMRKDEIFKKEQYILYRGDEAKILDVKPVLTIKLESKNQIICGDVLVENICLK